MFIIKQYNNLQETFIFNKYKDERIQINVDNEYVIFYYQLDKLCFSLSNNLVLINEDDIDRRLIISFKGEYKPCELIICYHYQNINKYTKYIYKDNILTIGNGIDNDIFIQDDLLLPTHIEIDLLNKKIHNKSDIRHYVNNKIKDLNIYKNTDLIQLLNLKLIIHEDFIMINNCNNIFVSLIKLRDLKNDTISKVETKYINKTFRIYNDFKYKKFEIDKPLPVYNISSNPLIFSMGPALTMSLASLTAGMLSMYNSYQQGREVIEIIPMIILPLVMLISTLLWNPLQKKFERKKKRLYDIERLLEFENNLIYLKDLIVVEQNNLINFINDNYLSPSKLNLSINETNNLIWQKQLDQNDYLFLYIGEGDIDSPFTIETKFELDKDLKDLYLKYNNKISRINNIGIIIDLFKIKHLAITKSYRDYDNYFMFLLLQLISYYSYEELSLIVLCDEKWKNENINFLNIKHLLNNKLKQVACTQEEVNNINGTLIDNSVVIIQNLELVKYLNIDKYYSITLCNNINEIPSYAKSYISIKGFDGIFISDNKVQEFKVNDLLKLDISKSIINLSRLDLYRNKSVVKYNNLSLFDVLNINKIEELDIISNWRVNTNLKHISVILGKDNEGNDINLDISEKGNGPHGLIAGMTGSGKSELIITLLLSLAIKYHPDYLQIVIIDYKGGQIIQSLKNDTYKLPHLIGSLSNLDQSKLRRCLVSFNQECLKRQKLFKNMSNKFNIPNMNIDIYQKYCMHDSEFEKLAHLIIVVDEFAQLKKQEYEFMDELISIARIGRSLGIHLILSTQKPSGVVDDQIWSNCRFKVCLKVQSKQDSYEMLHVNDASRLKESGSFYLLHDEILVQGQCAWSNAYENNKRFNVQILDNTQEVIKESKHRTDNLKTQLNSVMSQINDISNEINLNALWLPSLSEVSFNSFDKDNFYLGMIDDFYNRVYIPLTYENKHIALFSIHAKEKKKFVKIMLYSILRITNKHKAEIYVIDGLNSDLNLFYNSPKIIDILKLRDSEKIINLFKKCNEIIEKATTYKQIYIIINNITQFKEQFESIIDKYKLVLQEGCDHNINLILLSTTYNTLNYQEHNLINQKLCLKIENIGEVMSIFETSNKIIQNKSGFGLVKKDNILEFKLCSLTDIEIKQMIEYEINNEGIEKLYKLPYVPNNLSKNHYLGEEIPIGIDLESYDWLTYNENILITGLYTDLISKFISLVNIEIIPIKYEHINIYIKQNKSILWIGPGYFRQYYLPMNFKDDLLEDEAVYFHRGIIRKLKIITS